MLKLIKIDIKECLFLMKVSEAISEERSAQEEAVARAVAQERGALESKHREQLTSLTHQLDAMKGEQRNLETRMKEQRRVSSVPWNFCEIIIFFRWTFNFVSFVVRAIHKFKIS